MPPSAIKTLRDLIYWQYAKIISDSAGFGKKKWQFIMNRFKELQEERIFWDNIREYVKEHEKKDECIYCGKKSELTLEHLFPRSLGGPDVEKNTIWICKECNSVKASKRLYEWITIKGGLKAAKYEIPRIAEGKYLKFVYEILDRNDLLGLTIKDLEIRVCPNCDLSYLCIKENSKGKISPLCLDGAITLLFIGGRNG